MKLTQIEAHIIELKESVARHIAENQALRDVVLNQQKILDKHEKRFEMLFLKVGTLSGGVGTLLYLILRSLGI